MSPIASGHDHRSLDRLRDHYSVEKQLADRLRNSTKDERAGLYRSVYDELFRRVPDHPQLTRRASAAAQAAAIAAHVRLLSRFLNPQSVFLELGAGDCSLSLEIARRVRQVYAVDVSAEITGQVRCPPNMTVILSDGATIPIPASSVDVAFSHQLIEHMHVDDVVEHVRNVRNVMAPGGIYVCITPHAMNGPHDISKYFDVVARGFHMKEYTNHELRQLFAGSGFSSVTSILGAKGLFLRVPSVAIVPIELALAQLPHGARHFLAGRTPLRQLLGIAIVART